MSPKLIKIPIRRFEANKTVSTNVFIHFPLNNKMLRLVHAGDSLTQEMLDRIIAKGHSELSVTWETSLGANPETYPIYSKTNTEAAAQEFSSSNIVETAQAEAELTRKEEAGIPGKQGLPENEQVFKSDEAPLEAAKVLSAGKALPEAEQAFSADKTLPETEQNFSADKTLPETEQNFSTDKTLPEAEQAFSSDVKVESVTNIQKSKFSDTQEEIKFGKGQKEEETLKKFSSTQDSKDNFVATFSSSKGESEEDRVVRLSTSSEPDQPTEFSLVSSTLPPVKNAKSSLIAAQLSNRLKNLSEKVNDASAQSDIEKILEAIEKNEAGEPLPAELLASLEKEPLPAPVEEVEIEALARSKNSRDLSGTACRLAAYLGHSLGYANVDFLADLGIGAAAYFAKKEGAQINSDLLPKLIQEAWNESGSFSAVTDDVRQILLFLDRYLSDPDCDRTLKEIEKKTFYRAASSFSEKPEDLDHWSIKKWTACIERGPTMETHSLCTKAAAKALKSAQLGSVENV